MNCIRVSFLRDGKEEVWFTNYDFDSIRKLINLIDSHSSDDDDLNHFMFGLKDLLECSGYGD